MIRKHFRLKRIALGLAFAAFAAPSAQAMVAIDGPTGGEPAYQIPTSHGIVVKSPAQAAAYQLKVDVLRSQAMNRRAIGAISASLPVSTVVTSTRTSDGFNWSDAGIGASVTFGAVLFLLTAVGFGRKYRGRIDRSGLARA